jgi:hypothetical protein
VGRTSHKDGVRFAYMSLDEWKSLGATEQDAAIDRAVAADPAGRAS